MIVQDGFKRNPVSYESLVPGNKIIVPSFFHLGGSKGQSECRTGTLQNKCKAEPSNYLSKHTWHHLPTTR
jgi:hypothetical protein